MLSNSSGRWANRVSRSRHESLRASPRLGGSWLSIFGIFISSYILAYFILPVLAYRDDSWLALPSRFERQVVPEIVLWSAVAFLMFLGGYKLNSGRSGWVKNLSSITVREERIWPVWVATVAAAFAMWAWFVRAEGLMAIVQHREDVFAGRGIALYSYLGLSAYSAVISLLLYKVRGSKVILLVEAVVLVVLSFGGRGQLACYLLAVCFLSGRELLRKMGRSSMGAILRYGCLGLIVVVGFEMVFVRAEQEASLDNAKRTVASTFGDGEMFGLVYNYYSDRLLYGRTIWEIGYIFMPRQFFPDKPVVYGNAVFESDLQFGQFYGSSSNVSSSFGILAEVYANFGYVGLIVGMLGWGWVYSWFEKFRNAPIQSVTVFIYLMVYMDQLWMLRHGLLGLVQVFTVPVLMLPVFLNLLYRRPRQPVGPSIRRAQVFEIRSSRPMRLVRLPCSVPK